MLFCHFSEVTSIISDVLGSGNSQDDIIVWGRNLVEYNECSNKAFLKILKSGLKRNKKKCQIGVKSIGFLGHVISSEGVKVDPAKIEAITRSPSPTSVAELQQFLGMITYLGNFIPNLAEVTSPLRTLVREVEFKLEKPQLDSIRKLKLLVTTTPCLKMVNTNPQTCLKIDTSSERLGALLEQNHGTLTYPKWYPVRYASRSLRDYEKHFTQIEKETHSIVFGVERFHEYLYGRKFTVINDLQPLKSIFSKSIVSCSPRVQKLFLSLQKYEFGLKYSPGKIMLVSDALSRSCIKNSKPEFHENSLIHHLHFVSLSLPISNELLEQFKEETRIDPIFQKLIKHAIEGWPDKTLIPHELHSHFIHCSDISYHEGLLPKDQRILHQRHLGIENCKKRSRQALFCSLIKKELEDIISKYPTCLTYRNRQPSETPIYIYMEEVCCRPFLFTRSLLYVNS